MSRHALLIAAFALALSVFAFEVYFQAGKSAAVFYVLIVLLTLFSKDRIDPVLASAMCMVFYLSGLVYIDPVADRKGMDLGSLASLSAIGAAGAISYLILRKRIAMSRKLEKSEEILTNVFLHAPIGLLIVDREGRIRDANPPAFRLMSFQREELVGRSLFDLVRPGDAWKLIEKFEKSRLQSPIPEQVEIRLHGKGGRSTWVKVSFSENEAVEGDQTSILVMLENIDQRKKLESAVATASLREQRRIGRELHDGLGQQITGMALLVETLKRETSRSEGSGKDLGEFVEKLSGALSETETILRRTSRGLNPVLRDPPDLKEAVLHLAQGVEELTGIRVQVDADGDFGVSVSDTANHIFYIVREAVHNAEKHSGAGLIQIRLKQDDDSLRVTVRDTGCGMASGANGADGLGMHTMRFRASAIGADLRIKTEIGVGTEIQCSLPKELAVGMETHPHAG